MLKLMPTKREGAAWVLLLITAVSLGVGLTRGRTSFPEGSFQTSTYSYQDENGNSFSVREVLTVRGNAVKVVMEAGPSTAPIAPILTWEGQVIDSSRQVLTVKRDASVERRFFRVRDDGVVEELSRKKTFTSEAKA